MRTIRITAAGALVVGGLLGATAASAGGQEPASLTRCEADFLRFVVGSSNDRLHAGCEDLAAAYDAGVAAYRQRNAECDAISRVAHPIKRTECEARAKWEGVQAFRTAAKATREAAPPATAAPATTAAPTTTAAPAANPAPEANRDSVFTDGVNAVTRVVEEHPGAALTAGLGAAALAVPTTRMATFALGRSIPTFLTKLVETVKVPFAAVARALA